MVIFLSILLRGNASFAINCSHFHAWKANSCGSGVILMPAELLVQWQCVLCQETMGRQSASPHETQCSAAVVWLRSTGGGQGLGTAFIIPVLSPLCCLLLHLLLLLLASEIGNPWREGNTATAARLGPGVRPIEVTTDLRIDFTITEKALTSIT